MSEENNAPAAPENSKREKRTKAILILLIIAAMVGIYFYQRRGLVIEGWGKDFDAALAQAKTENHPLVILFVNKSQTPSARDLQRRIDRPGNRSALQQGNYITVIVPLDNKLDSEIAKKYKIKSLPTLLLLRPDGTEHNRATGNIGEVPFRQVFLNYNKTED